MFGTPRAGTGIEAMISEGEVELSNRGVVSQRKLLLPLSSGGRRGDAVLAGIYHELLHKGRPKPAGRVPRAPR